MSAVYKSENPVDDNQKNNATPNDLVDSPLPNEQPTQPGFGYPQTIQQPATAVPLGQPAAPLVNIPPAVPQRPIDTKIGLLRNWLIIIAVYVVSFIAGMYLPDPMFRIYSSAYLLLYIVSVSTQIRSLKAKSEDTLTEKERSTMVFNMALGVVLTQAIYWFTLKKKMPNVARVASRIGWKIFAVWLIYLVIFVSAFVLQSWTFQNADRFNMSLETIKQDAKELGVAANKQDLAAARAECQDIVNHTKQMQEIPPYTDEKIQADIKDGQNKIINGAGNCVRGIDADDAELVEQAAKEVVAGTKQLMGAIKAINEA